MATETHSVPQNRAGDCSAPDAARVRLRWHIWLWIAALPLLLLGIGWPQVSRTQEARVLETARQMLDRPTIDWIIPKLNGKPRLQKPPLAYWMTAAGYKVGRVSEGVGRVPNVILGWLTLGMTYLAARWLFGPRCGWISAACLLGSYYFSRHTRLAETDVPAMCFVTLSIYAMWRGSVDTISFDIPTTNQPQNSTARSWIGWMHLGAAAIGLAILSKGSPGIFPLLFLILLAIALRTWTPLRRFFASGALVTLAAVSIPWFVFVGQHQGWGVFIHELRNVEEGGDHGVSIVQYVPWFFLGTAPWPIVAILAIWVAVRQRQDPRLSGLLAWACAIALPLAVIGNRQGHYLVPLMPVMMIFTGWLIDKWNDRNLIRATLVSALVLPPLAAMWILPTFVRSDTRETARLVHERFGEGPYCFFGANQSIPLCFNLRQAIPFAQDETELEPILQDRPDTVIITIGKSHRPAVAPAGDVFQKLEALERDGQLWEFYRKESAVSG